MELKKTTPSKEEKISKKAGQKAKEEENIILKIQEYIDNNRKLVTIISIAVVAVTALFFVVKSVISKNLEENRKMALVATSRILPYYQSNDYLRALNGDSSKTVRGERVIGLVEIVDEYGNSNPGKVAALYAGDCYLNMSNINEARKYFDIALDSPSKIVLMGANAGMAATYEMEGDWEEAIDFYEKAAELAGADINKNRYLYFAALNYEKAGMKEQAENIFREIIAEDQYSEYANYSKVGLVRLGTIIE